MTLTVADFPTFYSALNGYQPFPWQCELVRLVEEHGGRWPAVLDLPTSAGKTSALDAAVFLLALQSGKAIGERTAALRTFFVVDRRIVVDEAGEKASRIAKVLNAADDRPDAVHRLQKVIRELRRLGLDTDDPLAPAEVNVVRVVAARLRAFGGGKALHVSVLRGGMYRDGSWAESPTQPTICLSTVDQVGSRLLFRGYGVSPYQRAVHAGLVGNDTLLLVDEAHLSRPFIESLKAVEFYRSHRWAEKPFKSPFQVVVMSATAGQAAEPVGPMNAEESKRPARLALDPQTDKNPAVCPELVRRLTAKKLATLDEASDEQFVSTIVKHALELSKAGTGPTPADVVGVVVNRVRTARAITDQIRTAFRAERPLADGETETDALDVVLLTGRVRPYDRDELLFRRPVLVVREPGEPLHGLLPFVKAAANRDRTDYGRPTPPRGKLFVVATQTVEVGADFSFDALVTEVAPIDALRQRFGRVDRLGFRKLSLAVIVRNKDAQKEDPVYGTAPAEVWKQLLAWEKQAKKQQKPKAKGTGGTKRKRNEETAGSDPVGIDFGIESMDALLSGVETAPLLAPTDSAPVMMPGHVDDWVQTTIPPVPDPNPELFLHGPASGPPDVSVVWRADVTSELLNRSTTTRRVVALVPPVSMEALPIPVWQARAWLLAVADRLRGTTENQAADTSDVTDVEGEPEPVEERDRRMSRRCAPFLRWRGPDDDDGSVVSDHPDDIRPGETIVVPSLYGGCDRFGWHPESQEAVADVADDCSWRVKRRPVLRVHLPTSNHRTALAAWGNLGSASGSPLADELTRAVSPSAEGDDPDPRCVLAALRAADGLPAWLATAVRSRGRAVPYPDSSGVVILLPVQRPDSDLDPDLEAPADDEGNSFIGVLGRVTLDHHCEQVRGRVQEFCSRLGLPIDLATTLCRAASLHDAGKADPRFQLWLYGSEAEAARAEFALIAKSDAEWQSAASVDAARRRAGWPKGGRHEALSVLMVRDNSAAAAEIADSDLLLHLIGTHHGRGRPLWPVPTDDDQEPANHRPPMANHRPPMANCRLLNLDLSAQPVDRPESALTPLHVGWVDAFWRMVSRYGWWGLAYLETLLVLADHRQSQAEREARA